MLLEHLLRYIFGSLLMKVEEPLEIVKNLLTFD